MIKDGRGLEVSGPDFSAAEWRKSKRSGASNGGGGENCVELAFKLPFVGLRDSKRPAVSFNVPVAAFAQFVEAAKDGQFD
ncbi:DUF397 domain-containing protein [Saccharothrix sp. NPDC042600]|uniref:DUF397 domain-containing protein n=1 Tax=Saccharothrix TaxID=2071 RepID=UPI0033F0D2F0|nr:hypothetical protein GCM10017745_30500 [Saccharothrix mutabilis subsp. capreolus]